MIRSYPYNIATPENPARFDVRECESCGRSVIWDHLMKKTITTSKIGDKFIEVPDGWLLVGDTGRIEI